MTVILTAFNGKLKSEPMDWPDNNRGQDIWMMMDMERPSMTRADNDIKEYKTSLKRGRFEATSGHVYVGKDKPFAEVYILVEIQ